MSKIRTHYDNLKVSRNAPDSVIKAAYKALCQTYHPDKFQGSREEAERIMKIINLSYEALIDPAKRAIHDRWIYEKENKTNQHNEKIQPNETTEQQTHDRSYGRNSYSEDELYIISAKEFSDGTVNQIIMAKAIVKANGDDKKVSAYYIELRVRALQEEIEKKCLNELSNLGCKVSTSSSKIWKHNKWEVITNEGEVFKPANLKELRVILDYCYQINDNEKLVQKYSNQLTILGCNVTTSGKGKNKSWRIRTKLNEVFESANCLIVVSKHEAGMKSYNLWFLANLHY